MEIYLDAMIEERRNGASETFWQVVRDRTVADFAPSRSRVTALLNTSNEGPRWL